MAQDLKTLLNDHMTNGFITKQSRTERPKLSDVDELADQLVDEYTNPDSRCWYCGVIYQYGIAKVLEWRVRAFSGSQPGLLFTSYVNQAGGYKRGHNDL